MKYSPHLFALFACVAAAQADDTRTARQRFLLHVPPKVAFEQSQPQRPNQPVTDPSARRTTTVVLGSTGPAGMTATFEVRDKVRGPSTWLNMRITSDSHHRWALAAENQPNGRSATGRMIQASSSGPGAATLVISSQGELGELEIVATILSND